MAASIKAAEETHTSVSTLKERGTALEGDKTSASSVADIRVDVDALTARMKATEARLTTVCATRAVDTYGSNLDGQQTAIDNPDYAYFGGSSRPR